MNKYFWMVVNALLGLLMVSFAISDFGSYWAVIELVLGLWNFYLARQLWKVRAL